MFTGLAVIMTLGGSPIAVLTPPILEKITSAIIINRASKPITSHRRIVIGVNKRIVVTLSRNADNKAEKRQREEIMTHMRLPE